MKSYVFALWRPKGSRTRGFYCPCPVARSISYRLRQTVYLCVETIMVYVWVVTLKPTTSVSESGQIIQPKPDGDGWNNTFRLHIPGRNIWMMIKILMVWHEPRGCKTANRDQWTLGLAYRCQPIVRGMVRMTFPRSHVHPARRLT